MLTPHLHLQAAKGVSETAAHTTAIARDVAASKSATEASNKLYRAWRSLELGPWMARLARCMVCAYFLNLCYEDVQSFRCLHIIERKLCLSTSKTCKTCE